MEPKIYLVDVTNRDGVQAYGIYVSRFERTMLNLYLSQLGVSQLEFGFPTDPLEKNYLSANISLAEKGVFGNTLLSGWVRALKKDVELASKIEGLKNLNLSISTSDIMIQKKFQGKMMEEDVIRTMAEAVRTAKNLGFEVVGVNAEDASRTKHYQDQSYLEDFAMAAKEAGASRFRYCDTLGYDAAQSIGQRVHQLASKVKLPIELHCHNDLGMAVSNSIEGAMGALTAGVDAYINTTVNGYGERAGNADLTSVILGISFSSGLKDKNLFGYPLNTSLLWKICNYASMITGIPIPRNQPGVGSNAFSHESGIHADGMLKDRASYELFPPEFLGIPEKREVPAGRIVTVGNFSGKKALTHVLKNLDINPPNLEETLTLVKEATTQIKRHLTEDEIRFIVEYPKEARMTITPNLLE